MPGKKWLTLRLYMPVWNAATCALMYVAMVSMEREVAAGACIRHSVMNRNVSGVCGVSKSKMKMGGDVGSGGSQRQ